MNALTVARNYLLSNDEEIDFYKTLNHLNSLGYELSEYETNELYKMISDIQYELSMVQSLRFWWKTREYNRLVYGI